MKKIYQEIASRLNAMHSCEKSLNDEWRLKHEEILNKIVDRGPSGDGIDCGTKLYLTDSNGEKIKLLCAYHHLNKNGYYDGWTSHNIIITPSLAFGYTMRITGRNRNNIKEYLAQVYSSWLDEDYIR